MKPSGSGACRLPMEQSVDMIGRRRIGEDRKLTWFSLHYAGLGVHHYFYSRRDDVVQTSLMDANTLLLG
jgi:hypothetical protein